MWPTWTWDWTERQNKKAMRIVAHDPRSCDAVCTTLDVDSGGIYTRKKRQFGLAEADKSRRRDQITRHICRDSKLKMELTGIEIRIRYASNKKRPIPGSGGSGGVGFFATVIVTARIITNYSSPPSSASPPSSSAAPSPPASAPSSPPVVTAAAAAAAAACASYSARCFS